LLWTARSIADGAIEIAAHRSLTRPRPLGAHLPLVTDGRGRLTPPTGYCCCQRLKRDTPRPPRVTPRRALSGSFFLWGGGGGGAAGGGGRCGAGGQARPTRARVCDRVLGVPRLSTNPSAQAGGGGGEGSWFREVD